MTFTEAAAAVLRLVGKPLHYKEITDVAIEQNLLSHVGKSPEVTMGARLAAQIKKNEKDSPLTRVKPGVFALAEWDEKAVEAGLLDRTPAIELARKAHAARPAGDDTDAESTAPEPAAAHRAVEAASVPLDEEEKHRAELSAGATGLFEEEDDDEQPIFGAPPEDRDEDSAEAGDSEPRDGKRRRRRRRGKRRDDEGSDEGSDDLPAYTVSDAPTEEILAEAVEVSIDTGGGNDADLADELERALGRFDRSRGPVQAQTLSDALKRKSDVALGAAGVVAIALADNLLSERQGRVARFRVFGPKVGLTAWSFDSRAAERLKAVAKAVDQVHEATLRSMMEQLAHLPQRSFGELVLVLLDRMGVVGLRSVRRPGSHGSELHLTGRLVGALGTPLPGNPGGSTVAVCIRRDGRDIGRERVTELRGALHHYSASSSGWIVSAGQVLSGAREEAAGSGASPVTLIGRSELAELCIRHGVGVRTVKLEVPVVDFELLDGLSGR